MKQEKFEKTIGGFLFFGEEPLKEAEKEEKGLKTFQEKMKMTNPKNVLQVYDKLLEQKVFRTPIGMCYLKELQEYLYASPEIENEEIKPLNPRDYMRIPKNKPAPKKEGPKDVYKNRFKGAVGVIVVLIIGMIAMFVITLTSGNATIVNYESKIIDRYEAWEQELEDREATIEEYEKAYGITKEDE